MDPKILLDRLDQKERSIVRLGRRLGRARFWLNGVEAKLGMKVADFLKLKGPVAGKDYLPFGMVSQTDHDQVLAARQADIEELEEGCEEMRKERDEARAKVERLEAQCAAVHPAEDMRRWRELAECEPVQSLAVAITERVWERDKALESRDEAHKAAMELSSRIDAAVHELREARGEMVPEHTGAGMCYAKAMEAAVSVLTNDEAAGPLPVEDPDAWERLRTERDDALARLDKVFELVGGCPDNMEYELEVALRKGREAIEEVQRLNTRPKSFGDMVSKTSYEWAIKRAEMAEKARDKAQALHTSAAAANRSLAGSMDRAATFLDESFTENEVPAWRKVHEARAILVREG